MAVPQTPVPGPGFNALGMIGKSIKNVAAQVVRPMTGTVISAGSPWNQTLVQLDSDPSERGVVAASLLGTLPSGLRVFCLAYPPRGLVIIGALGSAQQTTETFTSTGVTVWTKPANLAGLWAIVQAGGGAAGGAAATAAGQASAAAGGGGGACAYAWIPGNLIESELDITVGGGGTGVSGGSGGNGGTSSIANPTAGLLVSASGGVGGNSMAATAAASLPFMDATPGDGNNNGTFAAGVTGWVVSGSDGAYPLALGVNGGQVRGGYGGGSANAGGQRAGNANSSAGVAGQLYGGGASGSSNGPSQAARTGLAGGDGIVVLRSVFF